MKTAIRLFIISTLTAIWCYTAVFPCIGQVVYKQHLITGQMPLLERAIDLDRHNNVFLTRVFNLCIMKKDFQGAERAINDIMYNNNGDLTGWAVWSMKGDASMATANFFAARTAFQQALKLNPHDDRSQQGSGFVDNIIASGQVNVRFK